MLQIARVSHVLNVSRHIGKALNLAIDKTVPSCSHALVMHFEPRQQEFCKQSRL